MDAQPHPPTIAAALAGGRARLAGAGAAGVAASARLDAELLLAQALGATRGELLARGEAPLAAPQFAAYETLLGRRAAGEPLAYLAGSREFWSLPLAVTPAVLVPRPETELLVERALALAGPEPAAIADLGTGSGAIALALARERPAWQVIATDLSPAALAVAAANARRLELARVQFLRGDWCAPLAARRLRLVLSNPPYVDEDDPLLGAAPLSYEPRTALASGRRGLADLLRIIATARDCLEPAGYLLLEHGATQAAAVRAALVGQGYTHVRCHPDLAGLPRVTEARRA